MIRHLTSIQELSLSEITQVLDDAAQYAADPRCAPQRAARDIVCCAFFEPSTRTRLSFEAAAHRLGAQVIGFSEATSTSSTKGETLEDTVRILSGYADAIVLRHPEQGSAARAARASGVPVVNAGDGAGEHPTQALLDLFTIRSELGSIEGRQVAVLGDLLHGRTVHSLVPTLRRMGADVVAVPCPGLEWPEGDVPTVTMDEALARCDVLYATRIQRERFPDHARFADAESAVRIDRARLQAAGFQGILLHPLPRRGELATDVDDHPAAKYFQQAQNGVAIRMAVLSLLLEHAQ